MIQTLKPLKRAPLLHLEVQGAIRDYIERHRLRPNDPLPSEGELARALEVSRSSVREAVKSLESMGILETRRGSGVFVRAFSFEPLLNNLPYGLMEGAGALADLLEVRRILELSMIATAIERLDAEQALALDETLEGMRSKAAQGESFPEEDRQFHRTLFQKVDNTILLGLIDVFWLAASKASQHQNLADPQPMSTYRDHVAIVEAVKARRVDGARVALDRHYAGINERIENRVKPEAG